EGDGEGIDVVGVGDDAAAIGGDQRGGADGGGGDDGEAAGEGFEDDQAEGLVAGGGEEEIGGAHEPRDVGAVAEEDDAIGDVELLCEVREGAAFELADDDEREIRDTGEGVEDGVEVLAGAADVAYEEGEGVAIIRTGDADFGGAEAWGGV